jgi:uncharacterized glyoxalase superfamily protein PhnB
MSIAIRGACPLLQVFDMPTSITFYCRVLGFEVANTSRPGPRFDWALIKLNGVELMLNTAYEEQDRPETPDLTRVVGHADTCIYFSCPDVDGAYAYLRAQGFDVKPPQIQSYGMKQLYISDPDGYQLCFQWPANSPTLAPTGPPSIA